VGGEVRAHRRRRDAQGSRSRLDSGRRTARGATIWRAADGTKPEGYLTPKEARAALDELLGAERRQPTPRSVRSGPKTFGDAMAAYLKYVEVEKGIAPSTLYQANSCSQRARARRGDGRM
jgi:hypothetical protein